MGDKPQVNIGAAKSGGYRSVLEQIIEDGGCPFCSGNFRYHQEPILQERNGWLITRNSYSYREAKVAFIIVNPQLHVERYEELTNADHLAIAALVSWTIREFEIQGGGVALRFGEPSHTGASVRHLHAHLIVPEVGEDNKAVPVYFPIG